MFGEFIISWLFLFYFPLRTLIWVLSTSTFLIVHRSFFDDEHVLFQAKPSAAVSGAPLEKPIMLIKARDEGGKPGSTPDAAPPVSGSGAAKLEREGQRPTQPVYQIQNRGMASTASTCAVDRELFSDTFFFFFCQSHNSHKGASCSVIDMLCVFLHVTLQIPLTFAFIFHCQLLLGRRSSSLLRKWSTALN